MTVLGATPNTLATSFAVMGLPRSSSFITGPFCLTVTRIQWLQVILFNGDSWLCWIMVCDALLLVVGENAPRISTFFSRNNHPTRDTYEYAVFFKDANDWGYCSL